MINEYEKIKDIELKNCTFVKTNCMLLVVLYHSILYWNGNWFIGQPIIECKTLSFLADWLNTFHVYTFTFVSGYLFYFGKYEMGKYTSFKIFLKQKFKRLMVPYFFVSLIWVIPISMPFYKWSLNDLLYNFLLMVHPSQLWFLPMIFGVYIISYLLKDFYKSHTILSFVLVCLLYLLSFFLSNYFHNYLQIISILKYLLFFYFGFTFRQTSGGWLRKIPFYIYIIVDVVLFCFSYFVFRNSELLYFRLTNKLTMIFLQILGTYMCFFTLQAIPQNNIKSTCSKPYEFISKKSMTIYLFHQQIIYFSLYFLNGKIFPYLHALINFFVGIFFSLIIASILNKWNFTKYLIGEKK